MQKDARHKAEQFFLEAKGKVSNVEIAKKLGAHPITVGKWKRQDDWTGKLAAAEEKVPKKPGAASARKKIAHDEAFKSYLEARGKVSNKALADKVGVSATTISNWKTAGDWNKVLEQPLQPKAAEIEIEEAPEKMTPSPEVPVTEEIEIDVDALAFPDHITALNKQIDETLGRGALSPVDLKTVAEAKEAVLKALRAYLEVMEMASED
jgi:transposase